MNARGTISEIYREVTEGKEQSAAEHVALCRVCGCVCAHRPRTSRAAAASEKGAGGWEQGQEGDLLFKAFYPF